MDSPIHEVETTGAPPPPPAATEEIQPQQQQQLLLPNAKAVPSNQGDESDIIIKVPQIDGTPNQHEANQEEAENAANPFFHFMARMPWPFMVIVPIVFAILIGFGWSVEDKVETQISQIWIATNGDYAQDQDYAESLGVFDRSMSSFAAMATSRDGQNILTATRLEEIRARMEATENTVLPVNGVNYTWDDFCAVNSAPYQFPCLRISPMDLYQEARWTFTTMDRVAWYRNIIQRLLINPRLPRVGILNPTCSRECLGVLLSRATNPLALFADVGNMEYNHPCRMCIEAAYPATIEQMFASIAPTFGVLRAELLRHDAALPATTTDQDIMTRKAQLQDLATKLGQLITTITKDDVVDFFKYYVERGLYIELGAANYLLGYEQIDPLIAACQQFRTALNLTCPERFETITQELAKIHLAQHVDSTTFSSINTAGSPFPLWSSRDGTGSMFGSNPEGRLFPLSGSGIDMSGNIQSLAVYLNVTHYTDPTTWSPLYTTAGFADPQSELWQTMVERNPLYSWFMASVTPADAVCSNGPLPASSSVSEDFNQNTANVARALTQTWCSPFDIPNPSRPGPYTKQDFARMWFDVLITSPAFLDITQGEDDPYTWTTGQGCGYTLRGSRYSFMGDSDENILSNSSREIYNIDEGATLGAVDRNILIGGATPPVGEYDYDNPLTSVKVVQTLYAALGTHGVMKRVQNCYRPGGPVNITLDEAEEISRRWKEAMEATWTRGWNDENDGEVQFVAFFDDSGGSVGTTGRMLEEMTLDNTTLMTISIILIVIFSALFLFSFDFVESRVLITFFGVGLAVMAFFAGIGFGLIVGTKINIAIAWTLPFVIIGLGVDDVYIVLMAIKKQRGFTERNWQAAMKEVIVPVTMTSLVNASMFAVLNISDIPAIHLTSRVACYCVIALYISVVFCFPAWCFLDLKRQEAGRMDIVPCIKTQVPDVSTKKDFRETYLYDHFYKPIMFGENRTFSHALVVVVSIVVFVVGSIGIGIKREIGVGLEDFFPDYTPASRWAKLRTEQLSSWSVSINWGANDYTNPDTQMKIIKQFEDIVTSPHVAEVDTKQLWLSNFLMWTTRHCTENFARPQFEVMRCGHDQVFEPEESSCSGSWTENVFSLREKNFPIAGDETCQPFEGGICRPGSEMHPLDLQELNLNATTAAGKSFCPVVDTWSDDKWQFCLRKWREITGGSGRLLTKQEFGTPTQCSGVHLNDEELQWPIPYFSGPTMFTFDLFTHQDTLNMMTQTRSFCDKNSEIHCWMSGIPFDYWTQYEDIFRVFTMLAVYSIIAGFIIALMFLLGLFLHDGVSNPGDAIGGSIVGASLITVTMILTLVSVVGLSCFSGVSLTGFSNMSFVLSVGFAVEYSVHIVSRWMHASSLYKTSAERIEYTMSFLMLPTFMSCISSTIGTICLAFTDFHFTTVFYFRPLIIVMFVSYWFGCWFLPVVLHYLDFDMVKLGKPEMGRESLPRKDVDQNEP